MWLTGFEYACPAVTPSPAFSFTSFLGFAVQIKHDKLQRFLACNAD